MNKSSIELFWSRVNKTDSCWNWTGGISADGYGYIRIETVLYRSHRLSWLLSNGSLPQSLVVCHRCDNPICVNPSHLFLGTRKDNYMDSRLKNRHIKGETCGMSKLTDDAVKYIRTSTASLLELSKLYGVTKETISEAKRKVTWKHIP